MGIGELSDGDSNSISLGFSIFILSFQEYLHCAGFGLFSHFLHSLLQAFITEFLFYGGGQRFCFFFFFLVAAYKPHTAHGAHGAFISDRDDNHDISHSFYKIHNHSGKAREIWAYIWYIRRTEWVARDREIVQIGEET